MKKITAYKLESGAIYEDPQVARAVEITAAIEKMLKGLMGYTSEYKGYGYGTPKESIYIYDVAKVMAQNYNEVIQQLLDLEKVVE